MRILVVYATHDGQTEKIAHFLADQLRARNHLVDTMNVTEPRSDVSVNNYEAVAIGAPVRMERYPLAMVNFVRANRERLREMKSAFFSVCMAVASVHNAKRVEAERWPGQFFADTGWQPPLVASFAGALRYRQYNILLRWMMKRIARSEGVSTDTSDNHEYTDWAAVTQFADRIVAQE